MSRKSYRWLAGLALWCSSCLGGVADSGDVGARPPQETEGEAAEGQPATEGEGEGRGEPEGQDDSTCPQLAVTPHPGQATFGKACTGEADCASGVCVNMGAWQLCSKLCRNDTECPVAQNWHCHTDAVLLNRGTTCGCVFEGN